MSGIIRKRDPVAVPSDATVRDACRHMRDHRVGAVLVTEGDRQLLGIFTARDAVHRVLAEVMTRDPDCLTPGKKAIEALRLM
jgi:CBS domain-containing protein